ncbi:MAG: Hsp20/alpha crystallin family protein [Candidatus Omnitrophica bacterium]|nr:hypothetical protein [bacterium]NUN98780.1 Hsp20/alpha crystallin family protein [Candidatus Omnitrophota bacterium]
MVKNTAESTVPVAVPDTSVRAAEETTREPERYLAPAVDIYETGDGLTLLADLPGVDAKDLSVTVEDGILTLQAKREEVTNGQENAHLWREYRLTNFWRQFQLSDEVAQDKIKADLKNGVLTLLLPKAEEVKPKRIEVRVA